MTDPSSPESPAVDHQAWGARFGWIVGAVLGLAAGFGLAYLVETVALRGRTGATELAAKAAGGLFPACFLVGALSGHAFGARGGAARYKSLGVAAGVALLALVWVLLSIAR